MGSRMDKPKAVTAAAHELGGRRCRMTCLKTPFKIRHLEGVSQAPARCSPVAITRARAMRL